MILSLEKELEGSFDSDFISIAILFVCSLSLTNPHSCGMLLHLQFKQIKKKEKTKVNNT